MQADTTRAFASGISPVRAWYAVTILFLINVCCFADRVIISAVLPFLKRDLALSDTQLGFLVGYAIAISYVISAVPLSRAADRGSPRAVLALAVCFWSVMTAASGLVRNFWEMLLARMLVGGSEAACVPVGHSIISRLFPPNLRSGPIALHSLGSYVGTSVGLAAAGYAAHEFGWRAAFFLVGLPGFLLALLLWRTVPVPPIVATGQPADTVSLLDSVREVLRNKPLLHVILTIGWSLFATYGPTQWMPSLYQRSFGIPPAQAAAWFALVYGVGALVGFGLGGLLGDRVLKGDPQRTMKWAMVTMLATIPLLAMVLFAPDYRWALGFHVVATIVATIPISPLYATIQNLSPPNRRAVASSVTAVLGAMLGIGGGPFAVGLLSDLYAPWAGTESLRWALLTVKCLGVMVAVHLPLAILYLNRRDRAATLRSPLPM